MRTSLELGAAVAKRRAELGLTQQQVAFAVGVNRRVIGELERGKPSVQLDIALRAVDALGLDLHLEDRS